MEIFGIRGIRNLEQQIGTRCFFQGGTESAYQIMRQFADKADGICQQYFFSGRQRDFSGDGIQRGKQLVFRILFGVGQGDVYKRQDVLQLLAYIYAKKNSAERGGKKLCQTDKLYEGKAEELIFGELATALGVSKEEIAAGMKAEN